MYDSAVGALVSLYCASLFQLGAMYSPSFPMGCAPCGYINDVLCVWSTRTSTLTATVFGGDVDREFPGNTGILLLRSALPISCAHIPDTLF